MFVKCFTYNLKTKIRYNTVLVLTIVHKYLFCFVLSLSHGLQHKNIKLVNTIPMKQPMQAVKIGIKFSFPALSTLKKIK